MFSTDFSDYFQTRLFHSSSSSSIHLLDSPSSNSSLDGSSPQKRARADSPDTSIASCSPKEDKIVLKSCLIAGGTNHSTNNSLTSSNLLLAAENDPNFRPLVANSRTILSQFTPLHKIVTTAEINSSPFLSSSSAGPDSPPSSRPLSRRSSTGASAKSVRFARCTNANVLPCLSKDEYDRSPIVPTSAAESLDLPKRDGDEMGGWIKCVERERAAAAKKASQSGMACPTTKPTMDNPVEGVHGLIEGGYFVGEERDEKTIQEEENDENCEEMFVDDQQFSNEVDEEEEDDEEEESEEIGESSPSLVVDDSADSDSDEPISISSEQSLPQISTNLSASISSAGRTSPISRSNSSSPSRSAATPTALSLQMETEQVEGELSTLSVDGTSSETESSTAEEILAKEAAKKEKSRKCRERYGLCALGKYTRADVYSTHDSLGGF